MEWNPLVKKATSSGLQRPSAGPNKHMPHDDQSNVITAVATLVPIMSWAQPLPRAHGLQNKAADGSFGPERVWDFFHREVRIIIIRALEVVAKIQPKSV